MAADLAKLQIGYLHCPAVGGRRPQQAGVDEGLALWRVQSSDISMVLLQRPDSAICRTFASRKGGNAGRLLATSLRHFTTCV